MIRSIRTGKLFNEQHPNNYRDWVIGSFVEDKDFNTDKFEMKFQRGESGHLRLPKDVLDQNTSTLAILVYGSVRLKFISGEKDYYIKEEGDYIMWSPDEPHEFEFLEDTLVITLRW